MSADVPDTKTSMPIDVFREVVNSRRSVRKFDDTPLPEEVIRDCLELAMKAPNSSNLQPWEFHVVRSPKLRKALVPACFGQNAARTSQAMIVVVARTDTWAKHCRDILQEWPGEEVPKLARQYYEKLAPFNYHQGPFGLFGLLKRVVFGVAGFFRPVPRFPVSQSEMKLWATKSTALACENLMLALRAHGFDSCPLEGFDEVRVRKVLELPRSRSVVMIVAAGKRSENGIYGTQFRFDSERFIHFR